MITVYTYLCFSIFGYYDPDKKKQCLRKQNVLMFVMHLTAFLVMYLEKKDTKILALYLMQVTLLGGTILLYSFIYPKVSRLVVNNMCMLLSVGFIMLCRLDITMATKQLLVAAGASAVALAIPVMIRKMRFLRKLTWIYAGIGVVLLGAVFLLARTSYGAKLTLLGVQPSEAIKITFVFFMASFLSRDTSLKAVVQVSAVAAFHVGILVLSRDLGSAVIFFVAYLVMVYVSTRNVGYLGLGLVGGSGAAVVAYHLFGHVRQRVSAWKDPMAVYQNEGYQIVQSLFAIGTGGWFGMGLCQGSPESIPVVKNDFIFSAICEELGGIFAICLILVCMSFFLMIVNIALRIINPFYKLIALGLGTEYAFQVFLTIGGATKFIPMTGVTLPLVSYGGSSLLSTILMLAIIQGLYILREDEDEEFEKRKKEALQRIRAREEIGDRTRRF